jgi:hypothetical protein
MDPDCYRLAAGVYGTLTTSDEVPAAAGSGGARPKEKPKQTTTTAAAVARHRRRRQQQQKQHKKKKKTNNFSSLRTAGLGYLSLLVLVPAYATAQSFVGGDLSSQAPWGLPPQDFAAAIAAPPSSSATFPITGYNTSIPGGDRGTTDAVVAGWSMTIGVTAGIPLRNSTYAAVDRDRCIDVTALWVTPPAEIVAAEAGGYDRTGWRVCAVVFTGGLKAAASSSGVRAAEGSCRGVLPEACIRQLEANSVSFFSSSCGLLRALPLRHLTSTYIRAVY